MRSARTLAIGAVALALLAAGCSSSGDDGNDDSGGAISGNIRVWTHTNKSFNKAYQALADSYMAENPDVSIEFETFEYDTLHPDATDLVARWHRGRRTADVRQLDVQLLDRTLRPCQKTWPR